MSTGRPTSEKNAEAGEGRASPAELFKSTRAFSLSGKDGEAQRREFDDLLRSFEKLQEESRRRTTALAHAAHELKTPLAIMAGYLELLLGDKLGPLSDRQRRILNDMRANSSRLQQFIHDFLTYSALETGNVSMRFEMADLNACLAEVCSFWVHRFHQQGVALYFLTNEKLKPFPFDNFKVQHIVSNLLDNALKFTASGGTVWLNAEPHVWERRTGKPARIAGDRRRQSLPLPNSVRISVSDTGVGIAPEFQQEIFEDFTKASHDKNSQGMGLGLSIARRLVQAHGGRIWMESQPGSGSKFSFLIPLNPF
ncbi:MAG TPA: HAMP domain-containing sensor histidine kinase [Terriglobales bacterium]|nr:HAMP domain-containing sensor histidine kinase [Terriglobales bacterium]